MIDAAFERQHSLAHVARALGKDDHRLLRVERRHDGHQRILRLRITAALHEHAIEHAVNEIAAQRSAAPVVGSRDRTRLLSDVATVLSDHHVNILSATSAVGRDRTTILRFTFELGDIAHLAEVLGAVKKTENVYDAFRVVPH